IGAVAEEQHYERLSSDRPDADYLACEIAEVETPQHFPPVRLQRVLILRDGAAQLLQDAWVELNGEADNHRMGRPDPVLPLDLLAHLQECPQARAALRFCDVAVTAAYGLFSL